MRMEPRRRCFFCGEDNPIVLERHHIVPEDWLKAFGVVNEPPVIILCANCHRKMHAILRMMNATLGITKPKVKFPEGFRAELLHVLDTVRRLDVGDGASLEDIAHDLGLSMDETARIIDVLMREGFIFELRSKRYRVPNLSTEYGDI